MPTVKYHTFIAASLDGYIAKKDGDIGFLTRFETEYEDYGYMSFYSGMDAIVMGSGTYLKALSFGKWPYGDKRCIVCTKQKHQTAFNEELWHGSIVELNEKLEAEKIANAYVDGGQLISSFLRERMLASMTISTIPVILGEGLPLFHQGLPESRLELQSSHTFSSGLVQLKYNIKN